MSQGSLVSRTTLAGSLSKPGWLAAPDQLWAGWLHEGERLAEAKRDAVRIAVLDQELAGLSIVTDGEQTRDFLTRPVAAAKMSAPARGAALAS